MSKFQWLRKYAHLRLHTELVRISGIKQWCNSVRSFGSPSLQCGGVSADVHITKEATAGRIRLKFSLFPQLQCYFIPSKVENSKFITKNLAIFTITNSVTTVQQSRNITVCSTKDGYPTGKSLQICKEIFKKILNPRNRDVNCI
jgi:hypothetical protein